ncbi:Zn-dependent alcohol dehydrogenase [Pseudofrankia asymbiotica]|uniref:Enoyl reductase (ER) domain-containing protein n=1 Tax=Pseudofrankia asymbiotica TaxID=1834516 RepID=A0A1V2IEU3_9ACTN|nr:Zn-dependent alcohol dehydrogenase [Pseudofrankia asymbiotica]ONH31722.1 hypothetical protein BL253_08675 [Pseudofrankia asymbiotica]
MPRAALLTAPGRPLEVVDLDLTAPRAGEVRVRIAACGICHSDLHVQQSGLPNLLFPCVLGHEASGVVEEIGPDVDHLAVGDHVILTVIPQCGKCAFCLRGQRTLCTNTSVLYSGVALDGTARFSHAGRGVGQMAGLGAYSEEVVVPAISAVRIDVEMPLLPAALIGCGVVSGFGAVTHVAALTAGQTIAVIGTGGLGLSAVQAARIAGAGRIIAIDLKAGKLELARSVGATDVIDASAGDPAKQVEDLLGGDGVDVTCDFVVNHATVGQALAMTRPGGVTVITGFGDRTVELPVTPFIRAGRTLKGNYMGMADFGRDFPKLVRWYQEGTLQLDAMIGQTFSLDDVNAALAAAHDGEAARAVLVLDEKQRAGG